MTMNRRSLLALLALGIAGGRSMSPTSRHAQTDSRNPHPNHQATYPQVLPLDETTIGPQVVDRDTPICYTLALTTVADETSAELLAFLERTDFEFQIDSTRVPDSRHYWSGLYKTPDGQWGTRWSYLGSGKPPGEYSFSVDITVEQPFQTKVAADQTKTWSGTNEFQGTFVVR